MDGEDKKASFKQASSGWQTSDIDNREDAFVVNRVASSGGVSKHERFMSSCFKQSQMYSKPTGGDMEVIVQ